MSLQQVEVAILQHGPVHQSLVLGGMYATTPVAEIGRQVVFVGVVDIFWIERKQSAIEFRRPLAVGITAQHIAEQVVVAENFSLCLLTFSL